MRRRCYDPKSNRYQYYGEKGIIVCERWKEFKNFLEDMGERPVRKTLDRFPDKDGNYEPGNCRWASYREQSLNKGLQKRHKEAQKAHFVARCKVKPWRAQIELKGKRVHLGYFASKEEAQNAFDLAYQKASS